MDYDNSKKDKTSLIYRLRKVSAINATLLLLFCWIFLFSTSLLFIKRYEVRNLELISTILSNSLTASVVFEDSRDAMNKITVSGDRGMFSSAALFTENNSLIAEWHNPADDNKEHWLTDPLQQWVFSGPLSIDIIHSDKKVGKLIITGNIDAVINFIRYSVIILLVGIICVISASVIVSELLHSGVVTSLRNITQLIHNIIQSGDFDGRIPPVKIKELNVLSGDINKLLIKIQSLKSSLLSENQILAAKVLKDPLTGIYNRSAFVIHLKKLMDKSEDEKFALLFIDSDRFKHINDSWGHSAGDEVLKAISERLSRFQSENDMVARIGGDEFAMLMTQLSSDRQIEKLVENIAHAVSKPITLPGGATITTSVTVGYTWSHPADKEKDIIERADINMYQNKKINRGLQ